MKVPDRDFYLLMLLVIVTSSLSFYSLIGIIQISQDVKEIKTTQCYR